MFPLLVRSDSCPATRAATSKSPPFRRYSAITVPRKLWAQISDGSPAFRARRLIVLNALTRDVPRPCSTSRRPGSQLRKRSPRQSSPIRAALDVGVDVFLCHVMGGGRLVLPVPFAEPKERPPPLSVVIGDLERACGAHARKAIDEDTEERAVTKAHYRQDVDVVEKGPGQLLLVGSVAFPTIA